MALRVLGKVSLPRHSYSSLLASSSRAYVTVGVGARPARPAPAAKTPVPSQKKPPFARASTQTVGRGNPNTVETLPNTADEIDIVIENSAPAKSPSSPAPTPTQPQTIPSGTSPFPELSEQSSGLDGTATDWSKSYHGLSQQAFSKETTDVLLAPIVERDVEIKPEGLLYLPEIKYRRILNKAFGPGAWGLAPRSETHVGPKLVSREYALVCLGRLVAIARGEQEYFDPNGVATATEGCKSNALMRCCKDLGVASELWDPRFIREFKSKYCIEVFAEHATTKKKKKLWRRKDQPKFDYPWKE